MTKEKDLQLIITEFRKNWKTRKGFLLSLGDKYTNIEDVYKEACEKAYAPSILRALKYPSNISDEDRKELRKQSLEYLKNSLNTLFNIANLDFSTFDNWEEEVVNYIVSMYKNANVTDYTYGNGQKLVNMAIKYVLSPNSVEYTHPVFKYCHIPVDGIIQNIASEKLKVDLLYQNGKKVKYYSSWSKNDCRADFLDYQKRIRCAVQKEKCYSPIIWEIKS